MLQLIVDWLVYSLFRLNPESKLINSLNFFIYDSVKITLLLSVMISVIAFLRTYIPAYKVRNWIVAKRGFGNLFASIFGAITPFCSCSSIPIFLSFLKAGIPLGIAFSFLITSPLLNEYLAVLMLGFFGWKITLLYVISGILIGTLAGLILGRMNLETQLVQDMFSQDVELADKNNYQGLRARISFAIDETKSIIKKLWFWILIAVGIGALIHNYVPQETIQSIIAKTGIFSVPIATVLGVPMYGSCAAIVPIAVVLFKKGIPLGTTLAFMMAVAALSFPEAVMLRRAMKLKLIAIFFAIVTLAIIFTGYLFNLLQTVLT
ncbi:MAG: permease [Candidatus Omnitrophica bacterium]|nr:permease [Candidatus Omnitrophota bacterium]